MILASLENTMLKLAVKRLLYNKVSSLITTITLMFTVVVFLLLNSSLDEYSERLTTRTNNDIIIGGSPGSGVDMIMKSLYFKNVDQPTVKYKYLEAVKKYANTAPLFYHYTAQGLPVISTSTDYFSMRRLELKEGAMITRMGDCILGAEAAKELKLKVGDSLISESKNVFNPAGSVPVKLEVKGILKNTSSPDDQVIFTSLKTGWTMHGLGHAHPDDEEEPSLAISYIEFTEETLKTFHFHGEMEDYPLTAVLIKPESEKHRAFLFGESSVTADFNILDPKEGLSGFLDMLFHLDELFLIILSLVISVIALLVLLVFFLNLKLRKKEKKLFDRIGFEKVFFSRLVALEWFILLNIGLYGGYMLNFTLKPIFKEIFDSILRS